MKLSTSILILGLSIISTACSNKEVPKEEKTVSSNSVSEEQKNYWVHRLVDAQKLSPFVSDAGWQSYYTRDFQASQRAFTGDSLARSHLEHSALYRQALLMHSRSTKNLYTQYKSGEDPSQSQYLLAVASIFLGEYEAASAILSTIPSDPALDENIAQWKVWLATDKTQEPQLEGFFFSAEGASANNPPAWEPANYAFALPSGSFYEPSEGTSLWLRAKWHQNQAKEILKDKPYGEELALQWLAPWRLPFETSFSGKGNNEVLSLSDEWLLFGFYLTPEDLAFSAEIQTSSLDALTKWSKNSPLASRIQKCMQEKLLKTECLVDESMDFESAVRAQNKELTKDLPIEELNTELLYEIFPRFARYSLLRMGAIFALGNNQNRDSGVLQIMIREATGPLREPVFLTFFSAWEAGNNSTLRAQDLVHELSSEFSPLQTARVPLDFLHIRLGRNAVPSGASH